jgi:hypothetical protein
MRERTKYQAPENINLDNMGFDDLDEMELEIPMLDSISKTIDDDPKIIKFFPDSELGKECVRQFLTNVLIISERKEDILENCDLYTIKAMNEKVSPLFMATCVKHDLFNSKIDGISFFDEVEHVVNALKLNLKQYPCYKDEFTKENGLALQLVELADLKGEIWRYGLNDEETRILIDFWSNVGDDDASQILDDASGLGASYALSRYLGKPIDLKLQKMAEALTLSVLNQRL